MTCSPLEDITDEEVVFLHRELNIPQENILTLWTCTFPFPYNYRFKQFCFCFLLLPSAQNRLNQLTSAVLEPDALTFPSEGGSTHSSWLDSEFVQCPFWKRGPCWQFITSKPSPKSPEFQNYWIIEQMSPLICIYKAVRCRIIHRRLQCLWVENKHTYRGKVEGTLCQDGIIVIFP